MNQELEKLIDLALADGVLTDKEKSVLDKKMKELGVDQEEFEMVLEAKLFEKNNNKTENFSAKTEKFGDIKKCPACNAIIISFSSVCQDCGYEFRNIGANNSVKHLSEKLENVVIECNKMSFMDNNIIARMVDSKEQQDERREVEILERQKQVIKNFPIPNTREDILELLYFISPKTKVGFTSDKNVSAWRNKFSEIINRAKIAYASDNKTLLEIAKFENQQKSSTILSVISKFNELPKKTKKVVILVIVSVIFFGGMGILFPHLSSSHDKGIDKEKVKLEQIVEKINTSIKEKNYGEAEVLANQLKWEYSDSYSSSDVEKLTKSWDEKREGILNTIDELKNQK